MSGQAEICTDLRTNCTGCAAFTLHSLWEEEGEAERPRRFVVTCNLCGLERTLGPLSGEALAEAAEEVPRAMCPSCGEMVPDQDGFGVLSHPTADRGCGYCAHPSYTGNACDICGRMWPGG